MWFGIFQPRENMHMKIYSNLYHNHHKLQTTSLSIEMWMDEQMVAHPQKGNFSDDKK
jgi:hypothetical protein